MQRGVVAFIAASLTGLALHGCGCDESPSFMYDGFIDVGPDGSIDGMGDGGGDVTWDVPLAGFGSISGRVMSPMAPPSVGNFPISGALVYLTKVEPDDIPEGVYCNPCVEMSASVPHAFSGPDGTFVIHGISEGSWILVVRKGEFRKKRVIEVEADKELEVPWEFTTFPNAHNPANGDNTPSIAVGLGSFDDMQDIFAKIGLCELDAGSHAILSTCDHIDFYDNGGAPMGSGLPPFGSLLRDRALMDQYHIIFAPCSSAMSAAVLDDPIVHANVRNWVADGGKWYIADWSYDLVERFFADFVDFEGEDTVIGSANDVSGEFDTTGRAVPEELRSWIELGLGHTPDSIEFEENWDCITALGTVPGMDPDGNPISITPDVYCEGPITRDHDGCIDPGSPLTVTFPFGCGKVLFTTYHSVGAMGGAHPDLLIQEKILVYMILEVGLCTDPVDII
jgi:hypothetical protein